MPPPSHSCLMGGGFLETAKPFGSDNMVLKALKAKVQEFVALEVETFSVVGDAELQLYIYSICINQYLDRYR